MGIHCSVLRDGDGEDCTNGGITKLKNWVTVVEFDGSDILEGWGADEESPAVRIIKRVLWGEEHFHAEPIEQPAGMVGPMAGGNWIVGHCEAWRNLVGRRPIKIHDRFETPADHARLSM